MKKSLRLAIILSMLTILVFKVSRINLGGHHVYADGLVGETLQPGQISDTGEHTLDDSFIHDKNNWSILSGNPDWWKWDLTGNNYFWLANSKQGGWVYHMMDTTIDFSKPVYISTPFYYSNASTEWGWGDAAGFILTPSSDEQIKSNAPGAAGQGLGVNGLYNTIFMGRDLYYNPNIDGPSNSSNDKGIDALEIRKTNVAGSLETAATSSIPWAQVKAPMALKHDGLILPSNYRGSENLEVTWTDITTNISGTYTGTLTISSTPDSEFNNSGKYGKVSTSRVVTLQRNMAFGSIGVTGSNTGIIKEGNVSTNSTFSAMRGMADVTVNYIDSTTNKPINKVAPSIIRGNTGDYVGIGSGTLIYFDYNAPDIRNYSFSKGGYLKISNTKSNVLNAYYTPKSETATFKTYYTKGTPGTGEVTDPVTGLLGGTPDSQLSVVPGKAPTLSEPLTLSGNYNGTIGNAPNLNIPVGYDIDYVVGPDGKSGKTYSDLSSALADNSNFDDITNNSWANYFSIYLKAMNTSTSFTYKYVDGTRPNAPTLASPIIQKGVTGAVIEDPTEDMVPLPKGAIIYDITGPDGKNYNTLAEAVASDGNKYLTSTPSNFLINVIAPPVSVTIESAPDLDFGTQELKAKPIYDMVPNNSLTVTDETGLKQGWKVTAELIKQFTTEAGETINDATIKFSKAEVIPNVGNTSTAPTTSNVTLSDDGPVLISTAQIGAGEGQWQLKFPKVSLNTYGALVKVNQKYQATIEWLISNAP